MDPRIGKKVKVRFESTSQYGPWYPTWKEGYFAGSGEYGYCVQFEDGDQDDWFDPDRIYFLE